MLFRSSVPSTGRSGLQLCMLRNWRTSCRGFSTLYGSKWVATPAVFVEMVRSLGFSTLYGSKWVATGCVGDVCSIWVYVSVPSTGRSGLQRPRVVFLRRLRTGFSTLYGSKWVATFTPDGRDCPPVAFQYPLRVEVGCNFCVEGGRTSQRRFSTLYGSKWVATLSKSW